MKKKNDFEDEPSYYADPEVTHPAACLYCQHTGLMPVRRNNGKSTYGVRASHASSSTLRDAATMLVQKFYPLQGWRCVNCGFVMWFTPLDEADEG